MISIALTVKYYHTHIKKASKTACFSERFPIYYVSMRIIKRLFIVLLVLALLALGVWYGNNSIQTDAYSFTSPGLPSEFDGFRIVQLSDLHGRSFGEGNSRLIAAVERAEPDMIAITGDLVDAQSELEEVLPFIRKLLELAPVYYVTGNHEWGSGKARDTLGALRSLGVECLENRFVSVERGGAHILIAGVNDPNGPSDQKTPEQLAAELYASEPNPFWLLLAHRNNLFSGGYCCLGANLTLCGHAHGGVWRLPFTDGLIGPDKRPLPSFTSGFYRCEDGCGMWVFVSRGLGNSPHYMPRLFNRPQVAVITLNTDG